MLLSCFFGKLIKFARLLTISMRRITIKFDSLQSLSDCLYNLGIDKPVIDYYNYCFTAELSETHIDRARECGGEVVSGSMDKVPE
jgi:hypothetical protein